jgi:hypothetical protein
MDALAHVTTEIDKAMKRLNKLPLGSPQRARLARQIGCLEFNRLTLQARSEPKPTVGA